MHMNIDIWIIVFAFMVLVVLVHLPLVLSFEDKRLRARLPYDKTSFLGKFLNWLFIALTAFVIHIIFRNIVLWFVFVKWKMY